MPSTENFETFGDFIRKFRERNGLTLEDFGKKIGVTKAAVFNWEKNRGAVKNKNLPKLAKITGFPVDFIASLKFQNGDSDANAVALHRSVMIIEREAMDAYGCSTRAELLRVLLLEWKERHQSKPTPLATITEDPNSAQESKEIAYRRVRQRIPEAELHQQRTESAPTDHHTNPSKTEQESEP
jgi:transcriptional regulator with XRE-family HTH domain